MANHPKTIHKVTKPYMCVIYGFKFNIISRLEAHTRKHTGEKPYDTCSENFVIQEFKFHHHGHLQEKQYEYSIWKKKEIFNPFSMEQQLKCHEKKEYQSDSDVIWNVLPNLR